MTTHTIEITDSQGQSMKVLVRLPASGLGLWQTLNKGYFCFENGVADAGHNPTSPWAWLALYGGNRADDSKLVLHLDDCLNATMVNHQGTGLIYPKDHLLTEPGKVTWKLIG